MTTAISAQRHAELNALEAKLDAVKGLDASGFASKHALPFTTTLGYEPLEAAGLDRVKASSFALQAAEEQALAARGFVITERKKFPGFAYGYLGIYADDLPVYISADSILFAVHHSYDKILALLEMSELLPALTRLIGSMQAALASGAANGYSAETRADVELYLAVARGLLDGTSGRNAKADALVAKALAASGVEDVMLFGKKRTEDFSQFKPRGHYTDREELQRYFRATMWLGRIDLRILETHPGHGQFFDRRQLDGAYALRALMDSRAVADWKLIDDTIGGFVGEHDSMTVPQLDALLSDLKITDGTELAKLPDATIAQAVVNGSYGAQRISSHLMINGLGSGTAPLSSTFLLLGQRYVLDSHVLSNVVYDRVQSTPPRMLPNPLDVGFAALNNDHAGALLGSELRTYGYAPDLASMRVLAESHPAEHWDANLYNQWLALIRTLSPTAANVSNPSATGMPRVTGTEAWGRRILSTQLASWAELRHDTILYAKQSYTSSASCEYPDAYVEPYPELFARLAAFATKGAALTASFTSTYGTWIKPYFEQLRTTANILESMAKNQRTGAPHTTEQLAFVNKLTSVVGGCYPPSFDGWYAKLFFSPSEALEFDPTIADVHTQPTDAAGNMVGNVLHVGTTAPRTMVIAVETCSGPRAYVGLVSSYHEKVTSGFQRLNDIEWAAQAFQTPPEVPWFSDLVVR